MEDGLENSPHPELPKALNDAIDGSERIASAVQAASLFGQHDRGGIGPTSVNKLVETALRMAWPHLGRSAKLEKALEQVPEVLANEARLAQVVFQLLVHAADAMLGMSLSAFLAGRRDFTVLFEPGPRRALQGFFWTGGGFEYPLMWGLLALAILFRGGGELSLDRRFGLAL